MSSDVSRQLALARIARVGIFSALAFGANAPFLAIPNVEIFSLMVFLSGVYLGTAEGLAVGFVAGTILVFFNPNGPQMILLVGLAQIVGFMMFALVGGLLRRPILRLVCGTRLAMLLISVGALLTLMYDIITNLAFAAVFGPFWQVLIGGIGFGLLHLASNTIIFGMSSLIIGKIWKRIEFYMPPLAG
jgi:hypothetical protein